MNRRSALFAAVFAIADSLGAHVSHGGGFASRSEYRATRKRQKVAKASRRANR